MVQIKGRERSARTLANREFLAEKAAALLRAAGAVRVQRLFVGDNSVLANALGGPNPTLTTQAIATRTAERIFEKYFGGEPWVGREAPVSSLDQRVTEGVLAGEAG